MIFPRSRLPKKSLNWKSNLVWSMQVSAWFSNIPFHLQQIWMHTLVAINLESYQRSIPSFCALPSEVAYAVLLESYSLAVKPSHSELGNMGSIPARCWNFIASSPFCVALCQGPGLRRHSAWQTPTCAGPEHGQWLNLLYSLEAKVPEKALPLFFLALSKILNKQWPTLTVFQTSPPCIPTDWYFSPESPPK